MCSIENNKLYLQFVLAKEGQKQREWIKERGEEVRERDRERIREKQRSLWRRSRLSQVHICQPWLWQRINATDNLPNWANAMPPQPPPLSSLPLQSDHNWRALRNCNTRRCQFRAVEIYFAFKKRHILCLPLHLRHLLATLLPLPLSLPLKLLLLLLLLLYYFWERSSFAFV